MGMLLRLEPKFEFNDFTFCCLQVTFYFHTLCSFSPWTFPPLQVAHCSSGVSDPKLPASELCKTRPIWTESEFWSHRPGICIFTSSPVDVFAPDPTRGREPLSQADHCSSCYCSVRPIPPSPRRCPKSILLHILPPLHAPICFFTISNTRLMPAHCVHSLFQSTWNNGLLKYWLILPENQVGSSEKVVCRKGEGGEEG